MKNILFIDLDGTYVGYNHNGQYIPESAYNALLESKKCGNINIICTGRSLFEINTIGEKIKDGFDAIIGAGGGYIEYLDKVIFHSYLSNDKVKEIQDYFEKNEVRYYLETNDGLYANDLFLDDMKERLSAFFENFSHVSTCHSVVNKISFNCSKEVLDQIVDHFGHDFYIVRTSFNRGYGGEIANLGVNKRTAIELLLKEFNIEEATTYGFGDSMNDIEMFNAVDIKVAMGNARDGLKELADFVTTDLDDDGFKNALIHYGLMKAYE